MKKTIALSLCLSFLAITLSNAQDKSSEFGIKAGLNVAKIADNSDLLPEGFDFTNARFFHGGIFWNKFFSDHWGTGLELLYTQKGGQQPLVLNDPDSKYKLRFDYISLPLLAKFRFHNFIVETGTEIAYRINLDAIGDQTISVDLLEMTWDKKFDASLLFGLAYQIKKINVAVRYNYGLAGLTEIYYTDVNGEPLGDAVVHQNRVLQVSLGYALF